MPAFSDKRTDFLVSAIIQLGRRALMHRKTDITMDDMFQMFIDPDHQDLCRQAREVLGVKQYGRVTHKAADKTWVRWTPATEEGAFPYPGYIGQQVFLPIDAEPHAKYLTWLKWRASVDYRVGLCLAVFRELNDRCEKPDQVRAFWPSIVALLELTEDEACQKAADRLRDFKLPSRFPALSPEFKAACVETEGYLAQFLLYPKDNPTHKDQVRLTVYSGGFEPRPLPWDPARVVPQPPLE